MSDDSQLTSSSKKSFRKEPLTYRILLVDDDEDDFVSTQDLLTEIAGERFHLDWASTYNQALNQIKRQEHEVFLFDYRLGPHTGLELLKETKAQGIKIPVILLTGHGDHEIDLKAMREGAADYLVKNSMDASLLERSIRYAVERRRIERELELTSAQLAQSQKMEAFGQLAGGIAHDFNNIVSSILTNCELGRELINLNHPLFEYFDEIREAGERAATLTRQILAFSRRQILNTRVFELNEAVAGVQKMLTRLIGENIRLQFVRAEGPNCLIEADQGQIEQVIINLAINARDAMQGKSGKITITTRALSADDAGAPDFEDGAVSLSVRDEGCGISQTELQKIFEPYYSTKPTGKGTGLGLAMVKGIVEQTGGSVRVESIPGKGTTFEIILPRSPKTIADPPPARPEDARSEKPDRKIPPTDPTHVLLVEDNDQLRLSLQKAMERNGFEVTAVGTGEKAEHVFRSGHVQVRVIVSDVVLPGADGFSLASRLRDTDPELNVILISGYPISLDMAEKVQRSGYEFLPKPFPVSRLLDKMRNATRA